MIDVAVVPAVVESSSSRIESLSIRDLRRIRNEVRFTYRGNMIRYLEL